MRTLLGPGVVERQHRTALILDLGVGNLGNLRRALERAGAAVEISSDPARLAAARVIVLPGVGAFGPPREALRGALEDSLRQALSAGAWLLGVCVGYQLLFDSSDEFGAVDGLGLLPGRVRRLPETVVLPHIGWNRLHGISPQTPHPLLRSIDDGAYAYFVHSFAPDDVPARWTLAWCTHGRAFSAVAGGGRIYGAQFHPERSGSMGQRFLRNFLELANGTTAGD